MRAFLLDQPTRTLGTEQLREFGVLQQRVAAEEREAALARIKQEHGYREQDEVSLSAGTPNLETICAKFDKEHRHTLDEVRFVVDGEGIFDVRNESDAWVRIHVEAGDLIIIPANMYHRFMLTPVKKIHCVRLFLDHEGWTPLYREQDAAALQGL